MSVGAVMAGAAFVKLMMDDSSLQQGLNRAQKSIGKFSEAINVTLARLNLASIEMAAVFTAINMPMVGAIKAFGAFDDRMRQVQAVTGATGKSFAQLTEQAKKLGRETSFTAAQVSEGMLALGRMGLNPKEIEAAIQPMMNLARVTGTELGQAAEIAANNMRVFGLEASQMSHIADILSVTANSSAQTLVDLGESLKMAGPHAKRAGADLTETAAALGILANMGIRGSLAGTALGKSYKRLADPKVMAYLKQYKVETLNADGSMRKMRDTLVDIAKAMKTMTNAEQITFAEEVFDARGSLGGGTLSVNTEGIDLLMEKLKNSEGAAQRAADVMENGIGGTLRRLASAAEGVSLAFGEMLAVSFMPLINMASNLCEVLRGIIKENAGVIGVISRILYLGLGLGAVVKVLFVIGSALKSMLSPLLLTIKYFDRMVSGAVAAEAAKKAAESAAATATENAEKLKALAKTRSDAVRTASDDRRHFMELKNAADEARAVTVAEAQKVAAAKARVAQEAAINSAKRKAYIASNGGSSKGYTQTAEFAAAKADLKAQEAAMAASVKTTKEAAAASAAAKTATLQSAAAAKTASVAYATEAAVQSAANKKSLARAALLGKLSTAELFCAACSFKRAKVILATSMAEMVAAKKGAGASALKTAWYYAEAAGAKMAAGATVALGAALTWVCAHPVMAAIAVVAAAIIGIASAANAANKELERTAEKAKEAAAAMTEQREKGDENRQKAQVDMIRLQQLEEISKRGKLSADQMAEAEKLINSLDPYGSSQWASLDKTAGKLSLVTDAQKKFNDQMREAAKIQLESEIMAQENSIEKLQARLSDSTGRAFFGDTVVGNILTLGMVDSVSQHNDPIQKEIDAEHKKLMAMKKRMNAFNAGEGSAVTGKEGESTADRVEAEKQRKAASVQELADATKRLAELDEEAAKRKRSNLENEIENIRKVRDEYKKNIDLLLEEEKAKLNANMSDVNANANGTTQAKKDAYAKALEAAEGNRKKIAELEARLAAANAGFDQQTKDAEKKDAERRDKERKPYAGFLGELDADKQKRDADKQTDKQFSDAMEGKNYDAAYALMDQLFNAQQAAMQAAREKYQKMYDAATSTDSEGGADLTDSERSKLDELRTEIREGASRMESYQSKMDEAREAAADAEERDPSAKISGAWQLADLAGALNNTAADRTAAATEKSAMLQEKANRKLDNIAKNSVLSYT